jgi:hypothetical protein
LNATSSKEKPISPFQLDFTAQRSHITRQQKHNIHTHCFDYSSAAAARLPIASQAMLGPAVDFARHIQPQPEEYGHLLLFSQLICFLL